MHILNAFTLSRGRNLENFAQQRAKEYGAPVLFMYKDGQPVVYTYAEWRECVVFHFIVVVGSFQVPVLE